jgi:hypothetical protein
MPTAGVQLGAAIVLDGGPPAVGSHPATASWAPARDWPRIVPPPSRGNNDPEADYQLSHFVGGKAAHAVVLGWSPPPER